MWLTPFQFFILHSCVSSYFLGAERRPHKKSISDQLLVESIFCCPSWHVYCFYACSQLPPRFLVNKMKKTLPLTLYILVSRNRRRQADQCRHRTSILIVTDVFLRLIETIISLLVFSTRTSSSCCALKPDNFMIRLTDDSASDLPNWRSIRLPIKETVHRPGSNLNCRCECSRMFFGQSRQFFVGHFVGPA